MAERQLDGEASAELVSPAVAPVAPDVPTARIPDAPPATETLAAAVDEAVLGDVFADLPEAQPDRTLSSATDVTSLYIRHRSGLAAHARRFLRDSRDVDEVVQETFLRLFLAIDEIDTELQAIAFARRTLTNLCIDRYRADRRRPTLVNLDTAPVGDLSNDADDDDPVLRAEDAAIVREALSRLSPLHRAALVKREIEEKPLAVIAAELDVPEESVKHLLFRARRALRRLLVGTSVEPGVDLTVAEIAAIANRRAGEALMRGANVLIVLFVGALVAAVGVRSFEGRTPALSPAPGATDRGATTGTPSAPLPATTHRSAPSRHHSPKRGSAAPSSGTPLPSVAPVQHAPLSVSGGPARSTSGGRRASGGGASRAHFQLSGPLRVKGAPQVDSSSAVTGTTGVTTAASNFTAATSEGTFQLAQTVSTSSSGNDTVSIAPAFVIGDAVETPTVTGTVASVAPGADGTVAVNVVADSQPDATTNAFPLTSITAHFVLSPDLAQVLSESVALTAAPAATTTPTAAPTSGTPSAGTPTSGTPPGATEPSSGPVSGTPTTGTTAASPTPPAGDTSSGQQPGSQVSTPDVLEISDMSEDDRGPARSFSTAGGASA